MEGKIKTIRGVESFQDSNGRWHPLSEADMSHIDAAVSWWNREGYQHGPRSQEVRDFMTNSGNYYLDHYSINRSQGGGISERYRPPLE